MDMPFRRNPAASKAGYESPSLKLNLRADPRSRPKERCLAQRRWDAGWERRLLFSDLCASASLREVILVAADGRAGVLHYLRRFP